LIKLFIVNRIVIPRFLTVAVIVCAVLFLPWVSLVAAAAQPGGCPHCHGARVGIVSGHSCCPAGKPAPSGACGHNGISFCHCSFGMLAFIAPSLGGIPTWCMAAYVPAMTTMPEGIFSPHIFHPPESNSFFFQA
jgi:hypothetical protein